LRHPFAADQDRGRPRLTHPDYLHLRPLAADLRRHLGSARGRLLDLGCGGSPYRRFLPASAACVRFDLSAACRPDVLGRAEALPFRSASFDGVLAAQVLPRLGRPERALEEIVRLLRAGGRLWLTLPLAWPYDSLAPEQRFGEPALADLLAPLALREVAVEGGLLDLPFAIANMTVREAVRAAERRLGAVARLLRPPARASFLLANLAGRAAEALAARGPLSPLLGYCPRRLPINLLVVAERER
jgi:hypothetical protein